MASAQRAAGLRIVGPLQRNALPGLFARTCELLRSTAPERLVLELVDVAPDAVAVDALARLALAARRHGCRVELEGAGEELDALVSFVGLAQVLHRR